MAELINLLIVLIFCHMIGDYVLQIDFIAKTKGENWWHLIVHCVLYALPFFLVFGSGWQLATITIVHFIVDAGKARYKKINYATDQILHLATLLIYCI